MAALTAEGAKTVGADVAASLTDGESSGTAGTAPPPLRRRRAALLALLVAALAVLASTDRLHRPILQVLAWAAGIIAAHPIAGALLFLLLSALSAMLAFVSTAVLVPAALLAWGKAPTLALLWAGWILGGATAYGLACGLGRPLAARLASASTVERYERRLSRHSSFGLVLLFQLALPSEIPGYVLGLARYPFGRYLAAVALGELPYAVGTVYLGSELLRGNALLLVALGAAGLLLSLGAFRLLHQRLAR